MVTSSAGAMCRLKVRCGPARPSAGDRSPEPLGGGYHQRRGAGASPLASVPRIVLHVSETPKHFPGL